MADRKSWVNRIDFDVEMPDDMAKEEPKKPETQQPPKEIAKKPVQQKGEKRAAVKKTAKPAIAPKKNNEGLLKPHVREDLQDLTKRVTLYTTERVHRSIEAYRMFSEDKENRKKSISDIINEAIIEKVGDFYQFVDEDGNFVRPKL